MNTEQEQSVRDQVVSLLRLPEVERRVGLKRSKIYELIAEGKFPKQIQLGGPRTVVWESNLIDAWVQERITEYYAKQKTSAPSIEARP